MTTDPNPAQPQPADRPLVEAWGVRWHDDSRYAGELTDCSGLADAQWEVDHADDKAGTGTVVPLVAADRMEDDELVEAVVQHVRQRGSLRRRDAVRVLAALRAHLEGK